MANQHGRHIDICFIYHLFIVFSYSLLTSVDSVFVTWDSSSPFSFPIPHYWFSLFPVLCPVFCLLFTILSFLYSGLAILCSLFCIRHSLFFNLDSQFSVLYFLFSIIFFILYSRLSLFSYFEICGNTINILKPENNYPLWKLPKIINKNNLKRPPLRTKLSRF